MSKATRNKEMYNLLLTSRSQYADSWESTAHFFEQKGYYRWMADFVNEYPLILEVGTGNGCGTIELARRNHQIVSVEENLDILKRAATRLQSEGIATGTLQRGKLITSQRFYELKYDKIARGIPNSGVLLLEGDVLDDPLLREWLVEVGPFDAVICWLLGTHKARGLDIVIKSLAIDNPGDYRLAVQNNVYTLADSILRPGGILHIVDRGEFAETEKLKEDHLDGHRKQAAVTTLNVERGDSIEYEEPRSSQAMEMVVSPGLSGRIPPKNAKYGLTSVISRKPVANTK